jgi:octaprenyl-diphosphate synthase
MHIKIYSSADFPAYLPKLSLLYDDLFTGGKGFRAKLVDMAAERAGLPLSVRQLLCQTIEFIHNASLLHDDLVDQTPLRRGKTAAWRKYSPGYAVLAGDYLLARVMVNLSAYGHIHLVQYTAQMISDLLEGEWLQDSLVQDFAVNLEELDRVHLLKTASLFKWCLWAPFMISRSEDLSLKECLEACGEIIGQLFQRSDDLLDFDVRNHEGKELLSDFRAGYLNSFAAFCLDNQRLRDQALKAYKAGVRDLADFYNLIGGKAHFDSKLKEFDSLNSELIQLYEHHVERLNEKLEFLPEEKKKDFIHDLSRLPDILYWRKKPS